METQKNEIAFIDPSISDLGGFLTGLRPEIEAIVLDPAVHVLAQITEALKGRSDLDTIHIVAHGRPGEVNFAAGVLSVDNIDEHAANLAVIGKSITAGEIQLWTCDTAKGKRGTAFVDALTRATGAAVAASTSRVGAVALGGNWELNIRAATHARPPLTGEGIVNYAGVMASTISPTGATDNLGAGTFGPGTVFTFTLTYGENVDVSGTPLLKLSNGATATYVSGTGTHNLVFTYTVGGPSSGQDSPDITVTGLNLNGGTIEQSAASHKSTITDFSINPTGTQIIDTAACFYAGTLIQTPDGNIVVETLKRGDLILTTNGQVAPVSWVGRQTISTQFADPLRVLPIRIKAGAIADNVPSRDLLLSPDHAVLVDGALIQAGALVNGTSILRETNVLQTFTYYHIEVDDHSLILAENTPAETFVDNIDRMNFDNWAEHQALYPEGKSINELPYPRAKAHRQVPVATRVKLGERAQAIGAAADVAAA